MRGIRRHTFRERRGRVAAAGATLALAGVLGLQGSLAADGPALAVDSTRDAVDARLGDGVCATAAADCTLRAAIQEANALAGPQQIALPAGTYALALRPQNDNLADSGDHDVTGPLTIVGQGSGSTIIDAGQPPAGAPPVVSGLDRVLEVHASAGDVTLSALTLRDGYTAEAGGGIYSVSSGTVRLVDVDVLGSYAAKYGGGINNAGGGRVELVGSRVSGNGAGEGGAAVNNVAAGTVALLSGSVVSDNPGTHPVGAGAIHNQGEGDAVGTITIVDSTVSGNTASRDGAGINNARDGNVLVERSTLTLNVTSSEGGGLYTASGAVDLMDSTVSDNEAAAGGGIYSAGGLSKAGQRGHVALTHSTVSDNVAIGAGGGLRSEHEGDLVLSDSTLVGNEAGSVGGGIASAGKAGLAIAGGLIADNAAVTSGGGVHALVEQSVTIDAVVFADNAAGEDGGGLNTDGTGPVILSGSSFIANTAGADGGGISIHSKGPVVIEDGAVLANAAGGGGGGIQNSGMEVSISGLRVDGNSATGDGGGIDNTSSREFLVQDTTIEANVAEHGGGFANASDSLLVLRRATLVDNRARQSGGGFYSVSDGAALAENVTVSGNTAQVSGGGIYHDADSGLRLVNLTVWRNSAPLGGAISTTETDTVPTFPPTPNASIVLRNTIVGGSLRGGSCDAMLTSEGGNVDSGTGCLLNGPRDRSNTDPRLAALADNGGATETHALLPDSLAVDGGLDPCTAEDQRGVARPQGVGCDSGAFELVDAPAPNDGTPPETVVTDASRAPNGTLVFSFSGSDDVSSPSELLFECRAYVAGQLLSGDALFAPCTSPHAVSEVEHGENTFEVRAVDRAGNVDPTPARRAFPDKLDLAAPETSIEDVPAHPSQAHEAILGFAGADDLTPVALLRFECRLDGLDPFVPCASPQSYTDRALLIGIHTFEVRAIDLAGNVDASAAVYSWLVIAPPDTAIDSGPEDSDRTAVEFTFSSDQPPSTFECSLDGGPFAPCSSPHLLSDVPVGDHVLAVRATNAHGLNDDTPATHPWRVASDLTAPETTIVSGPSAAGESTVAELVFASSELQSTFACALDGAAFTPCGSPQHYAGLAVGAHRLNVRATDPAGNTDATAASYAWVVLADVTAPETEIRSGPGALSASAAATFELAAVDPGRPESVPTFECSLDGATFAACASPQEYLGLAEGAHAFQVRAVDEAGNVDASPASFSWRVDTVAPETLITSASPEVTSSTSAVFAFAADEPASFECSLDGSSFEACGSPQVYAGLVDGTHVFEVRAVDAAGNVDASPPSFAWRVDTVAPATSIDSGPDAVTSSTRATFVFTADEPGSFECSLDGTAFEDCDPPRDYSGLAGGTHVFEVRAFDEAGNVDPSPASFGWRVDTVAPGTWITSAPPEVTSSTSAAVAFAADEPASFECSLDGAAFADCASPQGYSGLADGARVFEVRAVDEAGNVDASPASFAWRVDTVAPETSIESGPPASTSDTGATFSFSSEPVTVFECSLDGTAFDDCGSPQEYTGLALGAHRFEVRATDEVGNTDASPAAHEWTIDAPPDVSPPETLIDAGPPAETASTEASFEFSASEAGSSFACSLDGAPFAACASPLAYADLALGAHRFEVRATDAAGNTDASPAVHAWTVVPPPDVTAPETSIDSGPPAETSSTDASFAFSSSEDGSSFECALDDAAFAACVSPAQLADLSLGGHSFAVRATDAAGNSDESPATHTWTVVAPPDTVAPQTVIDAGPATETTSRDAAFAFSSSEGGSTFECSLDGDAFTGCFSPKVYLGLALGGHRFEVRATDAAGNTDASSAVHQWSIVPPPDVTAPETSIDSGPDATTTSTSATFAFSANESGARFECALDGGAFTSCAAPATYTGLALGAHRFEVRATDAAGNVDASPASLQWTVVAPPDMTPPDTTIGSGPPAVTTSTSALFTFSANELGARFECALDGAPFTSCESPQGYAGLALGTHRFGVRATDAAGNTDGSPAAYTWRIDPLAPPAGCPMLTLVASADSWLDQNSAANNFGGDSILKVRSKGPRDNFRGLVRFALPPVLPQGCRIASARLRLFSASATSGRVLHAARVATDWSEGLVTWNSQPQATGTPAATASGPGARLWDVTEQVEEMYDSTAFYGFVIRDAAENGDAEQSFHSREKGESPPELTVALAPSGG